jgi:hypothetical protein
MTSSTSDISIGSLTHLSYVRTGLAVRVLIEAFQTQIQAMGIEFDRVKGLSDWGGMPLCQCRCRVMAVARC